jgi:hypothetical protein
MEKLMSKKVLMGAGLVLVAFLVYKAYAKKQKEADAKKQAEELRIQQSAKPAR